MTDTPRKDPVADPLTKTKNPVILALSRGLRWAAKLIATKGPITEAQLTKTGPPPSKSPPPPPPPPAEK